MEEIRGSRLLLRAISPDEVTPEYVAWMNDPEVVRYLESRGTVQTAETVRRFVETANQSPDDRLFGIFLADTGRHIGNIKIGGINRRHGFADVGLLIGDRREWGKGYAAEAIALATRFAFEELGLVKLTAGVYEPNVASLRAFLRAGYREAGRLRLHRVSEGGRVDQIIMERLHTP